VRFERHAEGPRSAPARRGRSCHSALRGRARTNASIGVRIQPEQANCGLVRDLRIGLITPQCGQSVERIRGPKSVRLSGAASRSATQVSKIGERLLGSLPSSGEF